jgi:hypothetical protein
MAFLFVRLTALVAVVFQLSRDEKRGATEKFHKPLFAAPPRADMSCAQGEPELASAVHKANRGNRMAKIRIAFAV